MHAYYIIDLWETSVSFAHKCGLSTTQVSSNKYINVIIDYIVVHVKMWLSIALITHTGEW